MKTNSKTNTPFLDNMAKCTDSENNLHIADAFNEHFVNIAESITKDIPKVAPPVVKEMDYSMFLSEVTENEVEKIIDNLEKKASSGDDLINNIIVKTSKNETVEILTYLINRSFDEGIFPVSLKKAKVIPLHKDGSKTDVNNYRPISLLTVWSKIFERVMYNRMYNYMEHFSLFYKKQFGFRSKHSTIDALVELTEKLRCSKQKDKFTFFLDLKKAFDTLDHDVLLQKKISIQG